MPLRLSICLVLLPAVSLADTITVSVPHAVGQQIDVYREQCSKDGGVLELDGDEVVKLVTDEGNEAYVIHAAFTCGDLGHLWCGSGGCSTQFVIDNKLYETNRILPYAPNRISYAKDGEINYWLPDGFEFTIDE